MAKIVGERVKKGDAIVDYEDKVFEDIQAEPGRRPTSSCTPCRSRARSVW